ncbi:MAG: vitamin K epoxide reductase family protein [Candidatus Obscuribacterales bacterium]|nr:vitamin K epoxide reductase family protein [Candidatus Obscuribacterales bacterium]
MSEKFQIKQMSDVTGKSATEFIINIEAYQYKIFWTYAANCSLGAWLILNHFLFDYKSQSLVLSDTISGALIITFEILAFSPRRAVLRWCTPLVAVWLLLAPFIFWSPTPAVFLLDTLIAVFVITFSFLIPGLPGKAGFVLPGPDRPPGWTYNPSSWIRRWFGIALALLGFFISRYLAAHQLGYIDHAYDPFFGDGSDRVTGSALSKSFPISDAGLGSVAYMLETLAGFMGDRARWRTAPWIAVMSAMLVLPLGATSVILVIMQPVVVGAWCGLCLISAAALLTSVPLAVHEAIAVGQFLLEARTQKKDLWQVFWMGGSIVDGGNDDPDRTKYNLSQRWIASIQGVTVPWTLVAQLVIGMWLMARPDIIADTIETANCDHLAGAMIVTIAAVATAEVTRIVRYLNVPIGVILVGVALAFSLHNPVVLVSEIFCGILLVLVSLPRGEIIESYASWNKFVR